MTAVLPLDVPIADPRIRDFLDVFGPARGKRLWCGGASLRSSLEKIGAPEAAWVAAGHDHSIWQVVLHCAYERCYVCCQMEGRPTRGAFPRKGSSWPRPPEPVTEAAWQEDKALLWDQHRRLLEAVAQFDPARLDDQANKRFTYTDFLWGIVMHDMYHIGEIQVLRRLLALRSQG